ncbi:hypothetical protein [Enterovibrio baiacu]|uniref:hypothetical protein n=1 Tax=Enterovibrio baiacu TaxID=2491023 RepID=UPI001F0BBB32|nr:hypothetical protein [Enterovibrio baiacu]
MLADFLPFPHDKGHDLFSNNRELALFHPCRIQRVHQTREKWQNDPHLPLLAFLISAM